MFAMKRVILTAAFIVAISGFAAAQSSSAKQANKQEKAIIKKGPAEKTSNKNTILKQETSANAKADSTVKILLPVPKPSDTTAMPAVKKSDEF
jgi:beta-lactam-binding protein with PASTA domain